MIVDVGDTRTVKWYHRDPDTDDPFNPANVTLTVTDPAGNVTAPAVTNPVVGTFSAVVGFTAPDVWLIHWQSTGPDEVLVQGVFALPAGSGSLAAPWAPTLRAVAAYVPSRTRSAGTDADPGTNVPLGTFTDLTMPTGDIVQELIGSACSWIAGKLGDPIVPAAYPVAQTAAALWAAYWVELTWPDRDADVSVWAQLRADAEAMTASAVAVNLGAGGGTSGPDADGTIPQLSTWSFPDPPRWADQLL